MKRWLLLLLPVLVILGLVCWRVSSGRQTYPSYQGRSLSSWLRDYNSRPIGGGLAHSKFTADRRQPQNHPPGDAIRAMGTNVIEPLLIEIKLSNDPPFIVTIKRFLKKLPWSRIQFQDNQSRREQAAVAFFDLGPAGVSAIPELTQLLTNYSSAVFAAHALAGMGTNAIPAFTSALANSNSWVKDCGAWGLAQIGPESRVAVPQILAVLPNGNNADQMLMLWALGEIREPVEVIRNELANQLKNADPRLRQSAAQALQKFGQDAKPSANEIKAALENETDADTRTALEELAKHLDP